MNIKISANLGFLWTDLSLEQAIGNASMMGFDAVECHWPYHVSKSELKAALVSSQMRMISINTSKGTNPADFGLNAIRPFQQVVSFPLVEHLQDYLRAY